MTLEEKLNLREAFKARCLTEKDLEEAMLCAEDLRAAGYNEETVEAMYETYIGDCTVIEGEFTLEKLMMAIDPDSAWETFWEETNA